MRVFVSFDTTDKISHTDLVSKLSTSLLRVQRGELARIHWDTLNTLAPGSPRALEPLRASRNLRHQFLVTGWVHTDISLRRLKRQFVELGRLPQFRNNPIVESTQILLAESVSTSHRTLRSTLAASAAPPIKMIALIRRRHDLAKTHFREHYESIHAPLIVKHRHPSLHAYRRNFLIDSIAGQVQPSSPIDFDDIGIDALTELWFADEAASVTEINFGDQTLAGALARDGRPLLDSEAVGIFLVNEYPLEFG